MLRRNRKFLAAGYRITLAAVLALHAAAGRAEQGGGEPYAAGGPTGPPETAAQAPVEAQGLRVYRDPHTGRLGAPPPGVQPPGLSAAELRMLNRSDRGLQSRTLPGGGVVVDLQGRYRTMAVATVGANRQPAVNCTLTPAQAKAALQAGQAPGTGAAD